MQQKNIALMYCPGGENEGGGTDPKNEEAKGTDPQPAADKPKEKGFIDKVKDALRDWSNDDQQEQIADDSTP